MNIILFCESCNFPPREMKTKGALFFNPETKSQNQGYECPDCLREVTVVITIPENPHGRVQTGAKEIARKK